jgi:hypothetical protein
MPCACWATHRLCAASWRTFVSLAPPLWPPPPPLTSELLELIVLFSRNFVSVQFHYRLRAVSWLVQFGCTRDTAPGLLLLQTQFAALSLRCFRVQVPDVGVSVRQNPWIKRKGVGICVQWLLWRPVSVRNPWSSHFIVLISLFLLLMLCAWNEMNCGVAHVCLSDRLSVDMIQVENRRTDLDEIWYWRYAIGDCPKILSFLQ